MIIIFISNFVELELHTRTHPQVGQLVFTADDAVAWKEQGKKVILCRLETSPEDISGMHASYGNPTVTVL
jgi:phosphoenolpyruvate synthase/pyruvate phosphate dikinase